jgi:S-adenosylmethionine:tRNA ribosyltransferase-isomerase
VGSIDWESVRVSDFHFDLPDELIAQHPPAERGASRMLVLDRAVAADQTGHLVDEQFRNLSALLRPGDLLVLNDSRVLPARLFAIRAGLGTQANSPAPSGVIEVLLTEQVEEHAGENVWKALVKPAKKVQPGETLLFYEAGSASGTKGPGLKPAATPDGGRMAPPVLSVEVLASGEFGERTLRFAPVDDFYDRVARIGHMPLPPYIRREQAAEPDTEEDRERYQTVFSQKAGAHRPGSAAAPTAGLHFTPEVLTALEASGVEIAYVTLHVGLGTFQPVRVERLEDIRLHAERYTLPAATAEALNRALAEGRRVVAVGTTTTRTLEHIAAQGKIEPHSGSTSIFIGPGHRFRVVSGLLTNFHLPESTLLMLVAAFAGFGDFPDEGRRMVLDAYAHAIRAGYRFYSYGDCMLVL